MSALLGIVLGVARLHIFYRALEIGWPESYFSISSSVDRTISLHPLNYLAFRCGPVFAVLCFVGVSVDRAGGSGTIAVFATAAVHALLTHGRGAIRLLRFRPTTDAQRNPLVALHVAVLGLLAMVSGLAAVLDQEVAHLIPPLDDIASDLWTAVAAASIGAYLVKVVSSKSQAANEAVERSLGRIPDPLWQLVREEADLNDSDADLAAAIMVAGESATPAVVPPT